MRIGQGLDLHPLVQGRPLWVGGVLIPFDRGLSGDSDGDVLLHAVIDALLGAAGLGDIGTRFPPGSVAPGQASRPLLEAVAAEVRAAGYHVVNLDATVVAQAPRLGPYRAAMQAVLADVLGTAAVAVKFKTADRLGVLGAEAGIAATAVVLLEESAARR
ncbi:MAG: 2-C-methyl-D-erythritol 2,4-cyclodiphosphate synthase [Actinomycetia bacterium]|nr:2-C-methyl-D-erythritol 2,4-cyclodiphosphate synthase [Actinomycetes bacterium]